MTTSRVILGRTYSAGGIGVFLAVLAGAAWAQDPAGPDSEESGPAAAGLRAGAEGPCRGNALRRPQRPALAAAHRGRLWPTKFDLSQRLDSGQTDIPRLREGGVKAQFWSVYIPSEHPNPARTVTEQIDLVHRMVERYPDAFETGLHGG